jgi:hypothetical protein
MEDMFNFFMELEKKSFWVALYNGVSLNFVWLLLYYQ